MTEQALREHLPCPDCNSSDALAEYSDHTYCFSCHETHKVDENNQASTNTSLMKGKVRALIDRGISEETCKLFGVTSLANSKGEVKKHLYPYTDSQGNIVAVKIRTVENKTFEWQGEARKATLFGSQIFPKGGKYITVCEGEIDAMTVSQIFGNQYAVVSIPNGAGSFKAIKDSYEYLDSFENIILCWDGDVPGQEAVKKVAAILPPKKTKIVKMSPDLKDPNEFLKADKAAKFRKLWWAAEDFRPEDITNIGDLKERLTKYKETHEYLPTPWEGLNDKLVGTRYGQLVILAAGTGLAKTTFLRSWLYHLLKKTNITLGGLFFEESPEETVVSLMSLSAGQNLKKPIVWNSQSKPALDSYYEDIAGSRRIELYESLSSDDVDYVIGKIRYLAAARDCKIIFLDHITYLTDAADNPRLEINRLVKDLHALCVELGITIIAACHLRKATGNVTHEEGGRVTLDDLKESSSIKQLSDIIIGLERNGQDENYRVANTTLLRVLKNRDFGEKGIATALYFDRDTTRLEEVAPESVLEQEEGFGDV